MLLYHKSVGVENIIFQTPPAFVVFVDLERIFMKKYFQVLTGILHILYPKRCPLCDGVIYTPLWSREYPVCAFCKSRVEYVTEPVCKKCGKPLTDERGEYCMDCIRHSHPFEQGKALWVYKGAVKESIYRLKYGNRREYGIAFAQELVRQYGGWIRRNDIQAIIPIPLHKKRWRKRGYNQADLIAEEMGRLMGLPVYHRLLKRCIHTKPQKELNDKERKNNLKKAFKITKNELQLDYILLVDDIYTTGSTMDGAAEALRTAGATHIYAVSVSIGRGY